ncbi:hypothetical protein [Croceicoccus mobilis]|uniref:Secreted protein n=1 Tax=Croceicoccus mobilis TaxID=1703339 RepID=A0A916YYJ6_9SPHN|nr:hypothetical protein [Croceicoccus mobilis]GGD66716.1 hypothetical protein GCM10010990_15310 [Croceicoccus mobilis]
MNERYVAVNTVNPLVWVIIAAAVIAALAIWYFISRNRTKRLRDRFGDEYDRTVETTGNTGKAEHELEERQRRVAALDIRPLTVAEHERFVHEWTEVKSIFVNSPAEAVLHADRTIGALMKARGFPVADFDQRHADLTVDHPEVARRYREGHDIAVRQGRDDVSTEDLRQAMIHYEALYDELIRDVDHATATVKDRAQPAPRRDEHVEDRVVEEEERPSNVHSIGNAGTVTTTAPTIRDPHREPAE